MFSNLKVCEHQHDTPKCHVQNSTAGLTGLVKQSVTSVAQRLSRRHICETQTLSYLGPIAKYSTI